MGGSEQNLENTVESTWLDKFVKGVQKIGRNLSLIAKIALPIPIAGYIAGCGEDVPPLTPFTGSCDEIANAPRISRGDIPRVYGSSEGQVEDRLMTINFFGGDIKVHELAARAFQCVEEEIMQNNCADSDRLRPSHAFAWRFIEGTWQRSLHSYGIAVDMDGRDNPHCKKGKRWSGPCSNANPYTWREWDMSNKKGRKKLLGLMRDLRVFNISNCTIRAFEKYGFEWGGLWEEADFMHFSWKKDPRALVEGEGTFDYLAKGLTKRGHLNCSKIKGIVGGAIESHEHDASKPEGKPTFYGGIQITRYYTPRCSDMSWRRFKAAVEMNGTGFCDGRLYHYRGIGNSLGTSTPLPEKYSHGVTNCDTDARPMRTIAVNNVPGTRCHIPYGSKVYLDFGDDNEWTGWFVAEDTGGAFHGKCKIDIYVGVGELALKKTKSLDRISRRDVNAWVVPPEQNALVSMLEEEEDSTPAGKYEMDGFFMVVASVEEKKPGKYKEKPKIRGTEEEMDAFFTLLGAVEKSQ
ncbi:M15 family metallopeptidase [Candidatus Woesearchaeota archaeon]|nr:M15 family metallopeptidase [Candidatus Woesearchaeota archaeon]